MFLNTLLACNSNFVDTVLTLYRIGHIPPNSYAVDVDQVQKNAESIAQAARTNGLSLYFMTKQIGRNPVLAEAIVTAGIRKAVAVDPYEALVLAENGVELGHVGHLVQVPKYYMEPILRHRPEVVTVFSLEAARLVSEVAKSLHQEQGLLLRVVQQGDFLYDAQEGGFSLEELPSIVAEIFALPNVWIAGVTSFPSVIVKDEVATPTPNLKTLQLAAERLLELGVNVKQVNAPSATCVSTIPLLRSFGATHGEPGHSLTGSTPLHVTPGQSELPSYLYITEISHCYDGNSFVFGGGYYPRGHLKQALVGGTVETAKVTEVISPNPESIDYYLRLKGEFPVGTPVVLAFRTQMFVTRANVVPVKAIHAGLPEIAGIYSVEGKRIG